jgi:hypothetical protein
LLTAKPAWYHVLIHVVTSTLALAGAVAGSIYLVARLTHVQRYLFAEKGDLLFSIGSNLNAGGTCFVPLMVGLYWLVISLFRVFPATTFVVEYYEVKRVRADSFDRYLARRRGWWLLVGCIVTVSTVFCALSLRHYVRVNDSGIYFSPFFSLQEEHYGWDSLKSVNVCAELGTENGKPSNFSPKLEVTFGDVKKDLWQKGGLGSPDARSLISFIDLAVRKSVVPVMVSRFPKETTDYALRELCNDTKRETIEAVYKHLDEPPGAAAEPAESGGTGR